MIGKAFQEITLPVLIGIVLFSVFALHFGLQNFNTNIDVQPSLTGEAVFLGERGQNPPTVSFPEDPPASYIEKRTKEPVEVPPPPRKVQTVEEKAKCWVDAGIITMDDLVIVEELLGRTNCLEIESKEEIITVKEENCIELKIGAEVIAKFCNDEDLPLINIGSGTGGEGGVEYPEKERNYLPIIVIAIIFVFAFLSLLKYYVHDKSKLPYAKKEPFRFSFPTEKIEISFADPEPLPEEKTLREVEEFETITIEKKIEEAGLTNQKIAAMISKFNQLSATANTYLERGNIDEARAVYYELLPIYQRLYEFVSTDQQDKLKEVVTYLNNQINLATKSQTVSGLIKKAYRELDTGRVTHVKKRSKKTRTIAQLKALGKQNHNLTGRPSPTLDEMRRRHEALRKKKTPIKTLGGMDDLNDGLKELKRLIMESDDKEAKKMFKKLFTTSK